MRGVIDAFLASGVPICPSSTPPLPAVVHIDPAKVIVTGVSQGGFAVMHFVTLFPNFAAGVAPLCGFDGKGFAAALDNCAKSKVFMAHGANDAVIPISESERITEICARCRPRTVVVPAGASLKATMKESLLTSRFVFAHFVTASDPLDGNQDSAGHAVWRDVYASSSPFWQFFMSL